MGWLARLFGGGDQRETSRKILEIYARCKRCGNVAKASIDLINDLSEVDEGEGYFTRKVLVDTHCYQRMELELHFDDMRRLASSEISGGEIIDGAHYAAILAGGTQESRK